MATRNQHTLLKFLGPDYSIKTVDFAPSVYRQLNDRFDIEITGAERKGRPASVYVWDISKGMNGGANVVERHQFIQDWNDLKTLLDEIARRYDVSLIN